MDLVFFAHPSFLGQQSMPRFTTMLADGMVKRGHNVSIWSPQAKFFKLSVPESLKKWLGYIDQYIVFPFEVRNRLSKTKPETLFVFIDNALGPWVPLVRTRYHAIHCHDFLAQKSALGQVPENPTRWTGKQYQSFIFRGYSQGKNFISVSGKTREDLHQLLGSQPPCSEVVYNGLNQKFNPQDQLTARTQFGKRIGVDLVPGYLLHVGGNPWYKNRSGVIEIYNAWRSSGGERLPLLLVGDPPTTDLSDQSSRSLFKSDIHWLTGIEDSYVRMAYAGASVFLFPSLAEGFGWPIAEAMASGCPVITTNEAPMTEVAGDAGFLIPRRPIDKNETAAWASDAAGVIGRILKLSHAALEEVKASGISNAKRFDTEIALDRIEKIYQSILSGRKENAN